MAQRRPLVPLILGSFCLLAHVVHSAVSGVPGGAAFGGGGRGRGGLDRRGPLKARPGGLGMAFVRTEASSGKDEQAGMLGRDQGLLGRPKDERELGLLGRLRDTLKSTATPGVLGRFMSVMWLHPLDTLKTRAQMVAWSSKRTITTAVYRSPGSTAGLFPALAGQVPNGLLTCVGFELTKDVLADLTTLGPRASTLIAAVVGDMFGHAVLCPAENLKIKLQTQVVSSRAAAVRAVLKDGLFKGYPALLLRDVPYRVLQLVLYEEIAGFAARRKDIPQLSLVESLVAGTAAGCIAAGVTAPLDLLKTRMMAQRSNLGLNLLVIKAMKLDKGRVFGSAIPKMFYVGSSTVAFFAVYEMARRQAQKGSYFPKVGEHVSAQ